jgi:toxin ParE1/3/4
VAKAIVPRQMARADVEDAVDHCLASDAVQAALDFVDELEKAYRHLSRQPGSGSPRYAHELNLPGLRFWRMTRFPYLIFYVEHESHVDVWRVLQEQSDVPAWMGQV